MMRSAPCAAAGGRGYHTPLTVRPFLTYRRQWRASAPQHAYSQDLTEFSGEENDDPYAGFKWLQQNEAELLRQAEQEQLEAEQAQSVGLYVRGRPPAQQVEIVEDDPVRYPWHRRLAALAPRGDYEGAEQVVSEMARAGHPAGPRAYHALVVSHIKGNRVEGALDAIRREVKAGIQPLPESYWAVVRGFVQRGDMGMAEAVFSSNRRSGVDCGLSWLVLTAAMFRTGQEEKGMQLLEQGEAEGRLPDAALYAQLIAHLCRVEDIDGALQRLDDLQSHGITPKPEHYSPVIEQLVKIGEVAEAEGLAEEAVAKLQNAALPRSTLNMLLRGYLLQQLPPEELQPKLDLVQRWLNKWGLAPDREAKSLLVEAYLQLGDLQNALASWRLVTALDSGGLQFIMPQTVAQLISQLSHSEQPMELYNVLGAMYNNKGSLKAPAEVFDQRDAATGCSQAAVWFHRRLREGRLMRPEGNSVMGGAEGSEGGEEGEEAPAFVVVDGVRLEASSLKVLNDRGNPAALSKLTVREIRAELTARRLPLYGNKKELLSRLQKARTAPEPGSEEATPAPSGIPWDVTEYKWEDGELVSKVKLTYYLQANQAGEADDSLLYYGGGWDEDEDEDEDEEGSTRRRRRRRGEGEDDEDFEDDDDDEVGSNGFDASFVEGMLEATQAQNEEESVSEVRFLQAAMFTNQSAGLQEMLFMHSALMHLRGGGAPSQQDVADCVEACVAQQHSDAAPGVLKLVEALRQEDPAAADAAVGDSDAELQALAEAKRERDQRIAAQASDEEEDEGLLAGLPGYHRLRQLQGRRGAEGEAQEATDPDFDEEWEELFNEFDL